MMMMKMINDEDNDELKTTMMMINDEDDDK